jgi:hypothetical protein
MSAGDANAILGSVVVLAVAIALLLALKRLAGRVDSGVFIALLLVPIAVYSLLSGRIEEMSGGGVALKFKDFAQASVATTAIKSGIMDEAQPCSSSSKGGPGNLQSMLARLKSDLPNALTPSVGKSGYYMPEAIIDYYLIAIAPSSYVVFVDDANKTFIGSAWARQVLSILKDNSTSGRFMEELENRKPNPFAGMGFLVTQYLTRSDTNATALQKFADTNADALVIVSDDGKQPIGVVDRNRLVAKLMVKLAS